MTRPILGYHLVRVAAIACVAMQHALASSGNPSHYVFRYVDLGQGGVAIFCCLSGLFAGCGSSESVLSWLRRRLVRVYLPYWLCLPGIFLANAVAAYKPASPDLIAAQFLGVASVTHPGHQVGSHFWFITLILICYAIAALVRWERWLLPPWIIGVVVVPLDPGLKGQLLAFLSGMVLGYSPSSWRVAVVCLSVWTVATVFDPLYAFPWLGVGAVLVGGLITFPSPAWMSEASDGIYEFFLIHPPIYLGVARVFGPSLPIVLGLGTALSIVAAFALRWASRNCLVACQRAFRDVRENSSRPETATVKECCSRPTTMLANSAVTKCTCGRGDRCRASST
jgi:hypothetical protein